MSGRSIGQLCNSNGRFSVALANGSNVQRAHMGKHFLAKSPENPQESQ